MARHQHRTAIVHPRIVRLTHWTNAAAMVVMIASGWQIYNAYPILPFVFPQWMTLGGGLGGALLWHFAAMWVLIVNFAVYIVYGALTGRFRRTLLPVRVKEVRADILAALTGRLKHADLSRYNAIQKVLYIGVIGAILAAIVSGFAIWKPVQFSWLTALCGGFQGARLVHFYSMVAISAFLAIHVVMAVVVPLTLRAMITGR